MKKFIVIVLSFVCASALLAAPASKDATLCSPVVPVDARLELYPLAGGPLSSAQQADLGLTAYRLHAPFTGFNFYRDAKACGGGSWRLETIAAGEIVYRGKDGYVAYRATCWNRLVALPSMTVRTPPAPPTVAPKPCPKCPTLKEEKYLRWYWSLWRDGIDWLFYGRRYVLQ